MKEFNFSFSYHQKDKNISHACGFSLRYGTKSTQCKGFFTTFYSLHRHKGATHATMLLFRMEQKFHL